MCSPLRAGRGPGLAARDRPHANTTDFRAGDVGLVRRNCGHYVENTGNEDPVFIETFRSDRYEEVSLANWLSRISRGPDNAGPARKICPPPRQRPGLIDPNGPRSPGASYRWQRHRDLPVVEARSLPANDRWLVAI